MVTFIEFLKTVFLGIIEGITEWLPISSTGHMIIVDELIKLRESEAFKEFFFVVIQLGAILAVVILFFSKIWPFHKKSTIVKPYFTEKNALTRFCNDHVYMDKIFLWLKILVASIPAAILGLLFDDAIDEMLTGDARAYVVGAALIFYGVLFIVIERINKKETISTLDDISYKNAFLIGVMQCLALVPGTSRSGTTILGAMLLGASRTVSAEFSFFLSIPAMAGGSGIKLLQYIADGNSFSAYQAAILAVGTLTAFIVSILAIKFLLSFIRRHDFTAFGWYRIVIGAVVILFFALRK